MTALAARASTPEWMDADDVDPAVFADVMHDLAAVNTVTRARLPTLAWLRRASRGDPAFTLLDVGFGDGDMLRAIARAFPRARLTGIDINPRSAPAARAATRPELRIDYRTGDAFALGLRPDFIVSSLVTHHMDDDGIVAFLRWQEATAVRGWFVNDLHRHWLAFRGFQVLGWVARWHSFVRHDGAVSVTRSFRRDDWERLLAAAGIDRNTVTLRWHLPFRWCVGRVFDPARSRATQPAPLPEREGLGVGLMQMAAVHPAVPNLAARNPSAGASASPTPNPSRSGRGAERASTGPSRVAG